MRSSIVSFLSKISNSTNKQRRRQKKGRTQIPFCGLLSQLLIRGGILFILFLVFLRLVTFRCVFFFEAPCQRSVCSGGRFDWHLEEPAGDRTPDIHPTCSVSAGPTFPDLFSRESTSMWDLIQIAEADCFFRKRT